MRTSIKRPAIGALAAAAVVVGGLAAAGTLRAQDTPRQPGTMMNQPGMMGMMGQMNQMMARCNGMMQGMMQHQDRHRPNSPSTTPEKKG